MGDEKEAKKSNKLYEVIIGSTKLFVFLYIGILVLHFLDFSEVKELISATGAFLMYAVSLAATVLDELN